MFAKLLLALLVVAAAHASTLSTLDGNDGKVVKDSVSYSVDCTNGLFCATGQTCMSTAPGAGAKLACSPLPNAVICNDKRFSCPAGYTCLHRECTKTGTTITERASRSRDAQYVASSTYDSLGSKICKSRLISSLPSFCICEAYSDSDISPSDGSNVKCQVNVGNFFNTFINVRFKPCDSKPTIGYSWGAGILGTNDASNYQEFTDDHNRQFFIPGTNFSLLGNGIEAQAKYSGKIKANKIEADVSLDVCGQVDDNGRGFSGCADQSDGKKERFSDYLDLPVPVPVFSFDKEFSNDFCKV